MNPTELTKQVLQELAEERASHGHGSAAGIDERMGKCEGYLGRVLRGEVKLQVQMLFEALEALDADAIDFFARALGVQVRPEHLLRRLERGAASEGATILDRIELAVAGEQVEVWVPAEEPGAHPGELPGLLARLDELRFSEPGEALPLAERAVAGAARRIAAFPDLESRRLLARALGMLAAVYRIQARFALAARCLRLALTLSAPRELGETRADLLQRTCYLLGDQGEYAIAAQVARQASDAFLLLNKPNEIGRSLVDRAIMLNRAGDPKGAIEAYLSSLEYLPPQAWYNRCSVFGGLGGSTWRGDLTRAGEWASRAVGAHRTREGQNWWRLIWLQGEIALQRSDLEAAESVLRAARRTFAEQDNPFDIAMISLRIAKTLAHGRQGERDAGAGRRGDAPDEAAAQAQDRQRGYPRVHPRGAGRGGHCGPPRPRLRKGPAGAPGERRPTPNLAVGLHLRSDAGGRRSKAGSVRLQLRTDTGGRRSDTDSVGLQLRTDAGIRDERFLSDRIDQRNRQNQARISRNEPQHSSVLRHRYEV